jgi:hypothetical protein
MLVFLSHALQNTTQHKLVLKVPFEMVLRMVSTRDDNIFLSAGDAYVRPSCWSDVLATPFRQLFQKVPSCLPPFPRTLHLVYFLLLIDQVEFAAFFS